MRTGIADLPLHYGRAPRWLFERMVKLAYHIVHAVVREEGPEGFIKKVSDPVWFQSLGCVLGFDWHSSGLTTTLCGALKEGLKGKGQELGVLIAGGKGRVSRKTPGEIQKYSHQFSFSPEKLVYASRMSAKVDSAALQDGYQLYHHTFIFTPSGTWAVIQQGMDLSSGWARRYHWLSSSLEDFVCEPHSGICCNHQGQVLNLVARESNRVRIHSTLLSREKPEKIIRELKHLPRLKLPMEHRIFFSRLCQKTLNRILVKTYENQPEHFRHLLGLEGVGPRTIRALALLSELIFGERASRLDPVTYSFAHGGKDGHPYPVDRGTYDRSIEIIRKAIMEARLGQREKMDALKRLKGLLF